MSHLNFKKNYNWQEKYYEEFKNILYDIGFEDIAYANTLQDIYEGCDIIADGVSIAIRIRKMHYRDITIRDALLSGSVQPTEYEKIMSGYCDYYFYCWTENEEIVDWVFIDMDVVRKNKLLDIGIAFHDGKFAFEKQVQKKINKEKRIFRIIDQESLDYYGAILCRKIRN